MEIVRDEATGTFTVSADPQSDGSMPQLPTASTDSLPPGLIALSRHQTDLLRMPGVLRIFYYSWEPDSLTAIVKSEEDAWLANAAVKDVLSGAQLIFRHWKGHDVPDAPDTPKAPWNAPATIVSTIASRTLGVYGHGVDKRGERAVFLTGNDARAEELSNFYNDRIGNWRTQFAVVPAPAGADEPA